MSMWQIYFKKQTWLFTISIDNTQAVYQSQCHFSYVSIAAPRGMNGIAAF